MRKLASWCFRHRVITLVGMDRRARRAERDPRGGRKRLQRQLRAAAHAELRRDPAARAQLPARIGRDRSPRDRGRPRQGHRSGRPRACRGAVREGRAGAHTSRPSASPYAPGAEHQISPSGQVAFANVTFDEAANHNKITTTRRRALRLDDHVGVGRRGPVPGRGQHRRECQSGQLLDRTDFRLPRRGGGAVPRVRLDGRDAAAADHGGPVARDGRRRDRSVLARVPHGIVLERAGAADRPRRRRRLRAVHRHPLPAGRSAGAIARRGDASSRSTPPGARCCSRA